MRLPPIPIVCPCCQEQAMATKIVSEGEHAGFCLICAGRAPHQVEGQGIVVGR